MGESQLKCKYATNANYKCNCASSLVFNECRNAHRLNKLSVRTDGAAFHTDKKDGAFLVPSKYCNKNHCVDFINERCKYATRTTRKWAGTIAECVVIECRAPEALEDVAKKKWVNFGGMDGARGAGEDADYIERRERFCCNGCPYFKLDAGESSF